LQLKNVCTNPTSLTLWRTGDVRFAGKSAHSIRLDAKCITHCKIILAFPKVLFNNCFRLNQYIYFWLGDRVELLGNKDVSPTMIYAHALKKPASMLKARWMGEYERFYDIPDFD
jgi:hypothetical protein